MKITHATHDEPASIDFDAMDDDCISNDLEALAEDWCHRATTDYAVADDLITYVEDDEDEAVLSRRILREVLAAMAMYGRTSTMFTDRERIENMKAAIESAYMPIARLAAETKRGDVEESYELSQRFPA